MPISCYNKASKEAVHRCRHRMKGEGSLAKEQTPEELIEELQREVERLKAQNASLRSIGKVNRETKNSVFLDMFRRKEYLIRLYRDLHPDDPSVSEDDLTVVTIENVFTIKDYNDLGFMVIGSRRKLLIMVEAQSKWSTNVIIRIWEYVIDTIMNYFINNGDNLYESAKVEMPDIETYVVYTGKSVPRLFGKLNKDENGRYILSLNKEFFDGKVGQPELLAKVIYMKNGSGILEEYIRFSQVFDGQMSKCRDDKDKARAIQEIFKICTEENILKDYLETHRGEVEKIMMTMVSPEYIEKAEQKSSAIRAAIKVMKMLGQTDDQITDYLMKEFEITVVYARNWLDAVAEEEDSNVLV